MVHRATVQSNDNTKRFLSILYPPEILAIIVQVVIENYFACDIGGYSDGLPVLYLYVLVHVAAAQHFSYSVVADFV